MVTLRDAYRVIIKQTIINMSIPALDNKPVEEIDEITAKLMTDTLFLEKMEESIAELIDESVGVE